MKHGERGEGRGDALPPGVGLAPGASSCQVCGQREVNRKEEATRCHEELGWHPGRAHVRYVAKEKRIGRKRRRVAMRSWAATRGELVSGTLPKRREEEGRSDVLP